jgi:hypothetical protein
MSSLKRAIVASLTDHPDAESYMKAAYAENPAQLVSDLARRLVITKADFLAPDDKGKAFIDTPAAWKNFDRIAEIARLGGSKFTEEDFTRASLPSGRTLLNSAAANSGTAKIFTFEIWEGRFDEMERLWYRAPSHERPKGLDNLLPLVLKRQLLAAEGKQAPEDRLAKAQLNISDIRSSASVDLTFNEVNRKLQQAGDYFRKDYALMPDSSGDSMFDKSFGRFDAITKIMAAHGERFEVRDYLKKLSTRHTLLERAAEHNALNKVFEPSLWADRLPEMLTLWSNVLEAWKRSPMTTQDFDRAYAAAEGLTYAKRFKVKPVTGKADLLTPLNPGLNENPVLPLGLKDVWDKFDTVQASLAKKGEALTTADLRKASGQMGDTCLISAAKFGHFEKVAEIARQSGQPLTMEDYISKDGHGTTLIEILAEKRQLSQVFTVEAWTGQLSDMRQLWQQVSASHRRQINFPQLETGVKQATLKKKSNTGSFRPRPQ